MKQIFRTGDLIHLNNVKNIQEPILTQNFNILMLIFIQSILNLVV